MDRTKLILWGGLIVLAGIFAAQLYVGTAIDPNRSRGSGTATGVQIGGDFTLTDHRGAAFDTRSLRGQFPLIYFGYSFCPDICPLELQKMGQALASLEEEGVDTSKIAPLFVTVDPERDTPESLADYVPNFHDRLIGLTGTQTEVDLVARQYRVRHARADSGYEDYYLVDHTSLIFLLDEDGNLVRFFTSRDTVETISSALKARVEG